MIAIGIDPSLVGTGIVSMDGKSGLLCRHAETIATKPKDWENTMRGRFMRYWHIAREIERLLPHLHVKVNFLACIEGYSFMSKGGKQSDRVELGALIRNKFLPMTFGTIVEVPPSSLKKFVTGKGNADKPAMAVATYKRWGVELANDNEVDAYGLAQIARCLAGDCEPETKAMREVIAKIKGG
jgi:crossover junction endodeoxyribonuclease RuvC